MAVAVVLVAVLLAQQCAASTVTISTNRVAARIRPEFVSFGWEMEAAMGELKDMADPLFRIVASHLAPAVVRIGGISADWYKYTFSMEHTDTRPTDPNDWPPFPDAPRNLSMGDFHTMLDFMRASNLSLQFNLNELYGRVCNFTHRPVPYNPGQWCEGNWDTTNVREFLQYVHDNKLFDGHTLYSFELGNELVSHLDPVANTNDIIALGAMVQEIWADAPVKPRVYAPSTDACNNPEQLLIMKNITHAPGVTGYTFHAYPGQSGTGNNSLERILMSEDWLRNGIMTGSAASMCFGAWNQGPRDGGLELLITEASSSWSWQLPPPAQNSFLHGMFTIPELGQFAAAGAGIVARWSFMEGSPFATIAHDYAAGGWKVAADYWLILAHKRLIGSIILSVDDGGAGPLIYAACGKAGNGSIVITAANPSNSTVDVSVQTESGSTIPTLPRFDWIFTAPGGDLIYSNSSSLNGSPALTIQRDGSLPSDFTGKYVADLKFAVLTLPPMSQAFFVLLSSDVNVCH